MESGSLYKVIRENDIAREKLMVFSNWCYSDGKASKLPLVIKCIVLESSGAANFNWNFRGIEPTILEEDSLRCKILKCLIQLGADIDIQVEQGFYSNKHSSAYVGYTAAMCAANRGFTKCLKLLIESGADVQIRSEDGESALTIAVTQEQDECVKYLLQHTSPWILNSRDIHGMTPLMTAALSGRPSSIACMEYLIGAGAKLDLADNDGDTALTFAISSKTCSSVDLLLHNGAVVNTVTKYGETPLTFALRYFDNRIIINLLRAGADPTLSGLDRDCLHETLGREHNSVVRALVMHGFPPLELKLVNLDIFVLSNNASDFLHQLKLIEYLKRTALSPLALAILQNRTDIAKFFIANEFYTRFDITTLCWDKNIRKLLLDSRAIKSLQIIDFLSKKPHSLFNLSLIAVSSALTQDQTNDPSREGMGFWVFRPSFKERVEHSGLPPALQRALFHQKPSVGLCCQKWDEIQLTNTAILSEVCKCKECDGVVRRKDETNFLLID